MDTFPSYVTVTVTHEFKNGLFALELISPYLHKVYYIRIGSNKGKTPEHNQAKHTKHPHSLEWHNSTITIVFPSTLRNTLAQLWRLGLTHPIVHI